MSQKICPEKLQKTSKTIQPVEVKMQKPETGTQTGSIRENCESADKSDGAQAGTKGDLHKEGERKRRSSLSEKAQEDKSLDEDVGRERISKRQRLTSKDDSFSGKSTQISGIKEEDAINGKKSQKEAMKKGLLVLFSFCSVTIEWNLPSQKYQWLFSSKHDTTEKLWFLQLKWFSFTLWTNKFFSFKRACWMPLC